MKYIVSYPSGSEFAIEGQSPRGHVDDGTLLMVAIVQPDESVIALDPRAIIRDLDGEVVYHPYMVTLDTHMPGMIEWLVNNPRWAEEVKT